MHTHLSQVQLIHNYRRVSKVCVVIKLSALMYHHTYTHKRIEEKMYTSTKNEQSVHLFRCDDCNYSQLIATPSTLTHCIIISQTHTHCPTHKDSLFIFHGCSTQSTHVQDAVQTELSYYLCSTSETQVIYNRRNVSQWTHLRRFSTISRQLPFNKQYLSYPPLVLCGVM